MTKTGWYFQPHKVPLNAVNLHSKKNVKETNAQEETCLEQVEEFKKATLLLEQ